MYSCGVKSPVRVSSPPQKPLLIFDGDCGFCTFWIRRWQSATADRVDYLPSQDPGVAARFPELRREDFAAAVHLIEPDGRVCSGAEAVFRALSRGGHGHALADWYQDSPAFAGASEWAYRLVAGNRRFFSALTRLAYGRHTDPPSHVYVRWTFLRTLGFIYLIAFVSLWVQITGLIGSQGIVPAAATMETVQRQTEEKNVGVDRYRLFPTLCWFGASDTFLKAQCAAGSFLAVLLIIGLAPAPCLFLMWAIYLSLTTVGRDFLGFQWDNLLLETGFLAIFLAPWQWLPCPSRAAAPSRVALWLLRWLLFRLMFESGCVKLLSGDLAWHNLTALDFHYQTQPLPTWIGWYAQQLPHWFQAASVRVMFGIELVLPFFIFGPRRARQVACGGFTMLQALIMLTGNYCFFNLLVLALCVLLLDDAALSWFHRFKSRVPKSEAQVPDVNSPVLSSPPRAPRRWPLPLTVSIGCISVLVTGMQLAAMFAPRMRWPTGLVEIYSAVAPSRSFNSYGLFAVMTTSRPEIIVEGSTDGATWVPYEFKYKPGRLDRRPSFVEPHQPRLDWQMWFAALGGYQRNPWFGNFCIRLLEGSPPVLRLMERNPFPTGPPKFLRIVVFDYRFTDFATRRKSGDWWRRELKRISPPLSLPDLRQASAAENMPAPATGGD
jgi:predicted DCC family thiol-disulfide oxidoreductase YuxK